MAVVGRIRCLASLTFTLVALPKDTIKQWTTMITKRWRHKCVNFEAMRQIDFESLSQILQNVPNVWCFVNICISNICVSVSFTYNGTLRIETGLRARSQHFVVAFFMDRRLAFYEIIIIREICVWNILLGTYSNTDSPASRSPTEIPCSTRKMSVVERISPETCGHSLRVVADAWWRRDADWWCSIVYWCLSDSTTDPIRWRGPGHGRGHCCHDRWPHDPSGDWWMADRCCLGSMDCRRPSMGSMWMWMECPSGEVCDGWRGGSDLVWLDGSKKTNTKYTDVIHNSQ